MKYWNGCKMGAYGVDIENCEDPQYKCICGNKFYPDWGCNDFKNQKGEN